MKTLLESISKLEHEMDSMTQEARRTKKLSHRWPDAMVLKTLLTHIQAGGEADCVNIPTGHEMLDWSNGLVEITPKMDELMRKNSHQDWEVLQAKPSQTALMLAAHLGEVEICELLLDKGAGVQAQDFTHKTARVYAREGETPTEVLALLDARIAMR